MATISLCRAAAPGEPLAPTPGIDFAIRVDSQKFDGLIGERSGFPNPDSAKERTMLHAMETGKIQAGEAGLRGLRAEGNSLPPSMWSSPAHG